MVASSVPRGRLRATLPPFPGRHPLRQHTAAFLKARAQQLEAYLRVLLKQTSSMPEDVRDEIQRLFPPLTHPEPLAPPPPPLPRSAVRPIAPRNLSLAHPLPGRRSTGLGFGWSLGIGWGDAPSAPLLGILRWCVLSFSPLLLGIPTAVASWLGVLAPPALQTLFCCIQCFCLGFSCYRLPKVIEFAKEMPTEARGAGAAVPAVAPPVGLISEASMRHAPPNSVAAQRAPTVGLDGGSVAPPARLNSVAPPAPPRPKFPHPPPRLSSADLVSTARSEVALKALLLTAAEREAVKELRRLSGRDIDDFTAWRYVRANNGSAVKGAQAYAEYMVWREVESVDEILAEPVDPKAAAILSDMYSPRLLESTDRYGRPVLFARLGKIDASKLAKAGVGIGVVMRHHIRACERMRIAVENSSQPELGHLMLSDVTGCSVTKFARSWRIWREVSIVGQRYYPELCGGICIVNGPSAAAWAIGQVKKILDPITAAKIELHTGKASIKALSRYLAPDEMPRELIKPGI